MFKIQNHQQVLKQESDKISVWTVNGLSPRSPSCSRPRLVGRNEDVENNQLNIIEAVEV